MSVEHPAQPLDRLLVMFRCLPPGLLSHLIDGLVEGLDDMEAIEHESGLRAMFADSADITCTHVAAGGTDLLALPWAERFSEETVDRIAASTLADPDHFGGIEIVDQRRVLVALVVGDLVDTEGTQASDPVTMTMSLDASMQQIRKR